MKENKMKLLKENKQTVKRFMECLGYLTGERISFKMIMIDKVFQLKYFTGICIGLFLMGILGFLLSPVKFPNILLAILLVELIISLICLKIQSIKIPYELLLNEYKNNPYETNHAKYLAIKKLYYEL